MSSTTIRTTLNAVDMPFLYRDASRGVILPGLDQVRTVGHHADSPDWNIPQLLYCENVMPTAKGLVSTQLNDLINSNATATDQVIILRDKAENATLLSPANGKNYVLDINTGAWNSSLPFTFVHTLVTRGYTQGRSFVFYEKERLFEYDGPNNTLLDRTASLVLPTGYAIEDIRGIGSASNYLLLFTEIEILWSSPTDPLNFNRSLNNGSGYQTPQDVRGQISCILPVAGGAIIYTLRNAVGLTYTNNAATPFVFRGISNSGGVASYEQVAFDADEQYQYVWGSGGLQKMSLQQAVPVFPEVSDMLTSGYYESYNYSTHRVDGQLVGTGFDVKMTYVAQRYLVISYGPGSYSYALIYDVALERWGKVKVAHVDAFTYPYPNISGDLTYAQLNTPYGGLEGTSYQELGVGVISISPSKRSLAFLAANGTIQILSIDYLLRTQQGVVIVGQYQYTRDRMVTLHSVELEGIVSGTLYAHVSLNGKTLDRVVEYTVKAVEEEYCVHYGSQVGRNISIAVEGVFQLTGLLTKVAKHGRL